MSVGAEERDVLSQLTGFVVFAGRYPIPTKAKDLTAKLLPARRGKWPTIELAPGTVIGAQTRAAFETVFARLSERLTQTLGAQLERAGEGGHGDGRAASERSADVE